MIYDCIIIGAGPAGLTAALYLARFRRNFLILDNKKSRCMLIPKILNYPVFTHGLSGQVLLDRLKKQLSTYQKKIKTATVLTVKKNLKGKTFIVETQKNKFESKTIILATGVLDIEPALPKLKNAIQKGLIRHCPICDGFEAMNQKIAVLGKGQQGIHNAEFLTTYSNNITYIPCEKKLCLTAEQRKKLKANNIVLMTEPIKEVKMRKNKIIAIVTKMNHVYRFDTIYSALGCMVRSELAIKMGAKCLKDRTLLVNKKQETNIKGFYAIGDVVAGINQIVAGEAQGAIAAIDVHKILK